jgi:tetratricopeptide (TPR) repeat protein
MDDNGYVYVLINPSMQNLVKIGKTKRNATERAKELSSTTGVPMPFTVVYDCYFESCSDAETYIHTLLGNNGFRVSSNREFFEMSSKDAIDAVMQAKEHFGEFQDKSQDVDTEDDYDPDLDNPAILEIMQLAKEYHYGYGEELQDIKEAIKLYEKAIKLGSLEAYSELDYIYEGDEEVKRNITKAIDYYKDGSKKGNISCYSPLATLYLELEKKDNAYKCWQKYFSQSEDINYMDGVNYLKFIATYPQKIEFIDRLKTLEDELYDGLYRFDFIKVDGEMCKINPEFIEHSKMVINGEINQNDTNLRGLNDEDNTTDSTKEQSGFFKKFFGF